MKQRRLFFLVCIMLLSLPIALGFSEVVSVSPTNATTTTILSCTVTATATGTLQANITWYVNDVLHGADNQTISLTSGVAQETTSIGDIETIETTKGENWKCQATIWNETNSSVTNSSSIFIANSPPVVTYPTSNQTAYEDTAFGPITATATDPDGDPIATWISSDLNSSSYSGTSLFSISSNGTIAFTPTLAKVGNHTMALLVTDGELFGGRNVGFEVLEINDSPVMSALSDQAATEGVNFSYLVSATDEEGDPLDWSIQSDLPSLIITKMTATVAKITFSYSAPMYADGGVHQINVTVYENATPSRNDTDSFILTVTTDNRLPEILSVNTTSSSQGGAFSLNVSANDSDATDELFFDIRVSCGITNPWTITTLSNLSSGAYGQVSVGALSNEQVICRDIQLRVEDYENNISKEYTETNITLNITNTNDAPVISDETWYEENTVTGNNLNNITAPVDLPLYLRINASDVDDLTYEGEVLTFSDNTSLFAINATTGVISFTPNAATNELVNITVTDDQGLSASTTLNLTLVANTFPVLVDEPTLLCQEDENCSAVLEATDTDAGENLTFTISILSSNTTPGYTPNTTLFTNWTSTNTTTIWKNFTNTMVGNYTYNITVTDQYGATDSQLWNITVNNTNDAPYFDVNFDNISDTFSFPEPVIETYEVVFYVNATDDDFANAFAGVEENLSLLASIYGPNISLFTANKTAQNQWLIRFTPPTDANGDYSVNLTVIDDAGANATQQLNFTIYNKSNTPVIDAVTPFYNSTSNTTEFGFANTSELGNTTAITLAEAQSYIFNISWYDSDSADENITLTWYKDGEVLDTMDGTADSSIQETYDYFAAGIHTYLVVVEDNQYEQTNFTWTVTVQDVNRPPQLLSNFTDRTINGSTTISDYMARFYDPDDDTDSNGEIDGNETSTLTYTHSTVSAVTITFSGTDTSFVPVVDGSVQVYFTASDGYSSVNSNNITLELIVDQEETSSSSSGGGGGGGGSSAVPIRIPDTKDDTQESIELVVPKPLTMYYNQTIAVPIQVQNPLDVTVRTISLSASSEANVTLQYSTELITQLVPGEKRNVTLYVTNYREPGGFEITIFGQAQDPHVNDTAIIFINSLEQTSEGDSVQTKVTFARDLVAANPECVELNEIIGQAQQALATGQATLANKMLDAVVEGCRYLVTQSARQEEVPQGFDLGFLSRYRYSNVVLAGLLILLVGVATMLFLHYHSAAKQE